MMGKNSREPLRVIGGGLAGLALAIALRRRDIPVSVIEASRYPRHKVCGEFIAGLTAGCRETLGLDAFLADALRHETVAWIRRGRVFRRDRLPSPALGISRYRLDARLAEALVELGGKLEQGRRVAFNALAGQEGVVWTAGRRRQRSEWIGIKLHCREMSLCADLEVHLGENGYAGASTVEEGRVNVCALLRRRAAPLTQRRQEAFFECLEEAGLGALAQRAREGKPDLASQTTVAALAFGKADRAEYSCMQVGDAYALTPPFTGDGMAMAFEGAAMAVDPLVRYWRGQSSWRHVVAEARDALNQLFRTRLAMAGALHPFVYRSPGQTAFQAIASARLLPFKRLFHLLH